MLTTEVRGLASTIERMKRAPARVKEANFAGIKKASFIVYRALRQELSSPAADDPFWGKLGGRPGLAIRTGKTRNRLSPGGHVLRYGDSAVAAVGSPDEHVRRAELGGVVNGSPFLRIPTREAQTPGGVDRNPGSVRGIAGYFVIRSHAGRLWIASNTGVGGGIGPATRGSRGTQRLTLLYLLVRSVRIRPRTIFARTTARVTPVIKATLGTEISAVVREANGAAV